MPDSVFIQAHPFRDGMELVNVSEDVMDILEMTGFADILVIK